MYEPEWLSLCLNTWKLLFFNSHKENVGPVRLSFWIPPLSWGFPCGPVVNNLPARAGDAGLIPGSGRILKEEMATHSVFLPGESHGQRSLVATVQEVSKSRRPLSMPSHTGRKRKSTILCNVDRTELQIAMVRLLKTEQKQTNRQNRTCMICSSWRSESLISAEAGQTHPVNYLVN